MCFLYVVTCADRLHFSSADFFLSIKLIYNWGILFSVIWTWSMHWSLIFFYKFCIIFIWCQKMDRTQYMHIEMWQELRTHWSWFECMMLAFNYLGDLHFKWVWPLKSIKCWCVNRTLRHIWIHYHIHSIDNLRRKTTLEVNYKRLIDIDYNGLLNTGYKKTMKNTYQ